jgi:D-glycero-D-manno-heptose 1,7-bisphosphate phosphatase
MSDDNRLINHYENINNDIRDEMKKRIAQRDTYSNQTIIALAAIIAIAFGPLNFDKALIAAPLISIYFTVLILYSYRIHQYLSDYLINVVYSKYEKLYENITITDEWELYHRLNNTKPGIRKRFFKVSMIVVTVISGTILLLKYRWITEFGKIVSFLYGIYSCAILYILLVIFRNEKKGAKRFFPQHMKKENKCIAVFIDRDGTINEDTHYPHRIEDLHVFDDAKKALSLLKSENIKVVIITNQAGINLGIYTYKDMEKFNNALLNEINKANGKIDAIYFTTDNEPQSRAQEAISSAKPSPAMIELAAKEMNIDLKKSFLIGDKKTDIAAGKRLGLSCYLVNTGKRGEDDYYGSIDNYYTVDTILGAVDKIIESI